MSLILKNLVKEDSFLEKTSVAKTFKDILFEKIPIGLITLNVSGRIINYNTAAQQIFGFSSHDVLGKNFMDFAAEFLPNSLLLRSLATGEEFAHNECPIPGKGKRIVAEHTALLTNSLNQTIGVIGIYHDITTVKQYEQEIINKEKLATVGRLAAGIAHEIRNPLTTIKGFLQLMESKTTDFPTKEYLPLILEEIDRINSLIKEMLLLAQPSPPKFETTNLNSIINKMLPFYIKVAEEQNTIIHTELDDNLPNILGDVNQLKQVILNILQNALQAIKDSGEIRIKTFAKPDTGHVCLSISDNGCGIAPENIDNIFDPFFSTKANGTGLGLSLCQRILEKHNCRLKVKSKLNEGTTFCLAFPKCEE